MHEPVPPKPITETDPDTGEVTVTNQEEIDNFKEKPSIYKHIFPESVISLRATEQMIKRRAKATMKSGMNGADKWEENRLRDKMNAYSMTNKLSLFK